MFEFNLISLLGTIFAKTRKTAYTIILGIVFSGISILAVKNYWDVTFAKFLSVWQTHIIIITIAASCLFFGAVLVDLFLIFVNAQSKKNPTLKIILREDTSWCYLTRQRNGNFTSQINISANFTNLTDSPIYLIKTRIIKPKMIGKIIDAQILLPQEGSPYHDPNHPLPPRNTLEGSVHLMYEGKIKLKDKNLKFTVGITDQYGNEHQLDGIIHRVNLPNEEILPNSLLFKLIKKCFNFFRQM